MKKELIEILKSGEIKNEKQANIFASEAVFTDSKEIKRGYGVFTLKTENGFAEIRGRREWGESDGKPIPLFNPCADEGKDGFWQTIRFYKK